MISKTDFGVIDIQVNFAFVSTANPKCTLIFFIPKDKIGEAEQGDVVLVHIEDWPKAAESLKEKGLTILRLKTGTPPRILRDL